MAHLRSITRSETMKEYHSNVDNLKRAVKFSEERVRNHFVTGLEKHGYL